jgi:hypothetical protein
LPKIKTVSGLYIQTIIVQQKVEDVQDENTFVVNICWRHSTRDDDFLEIVVDLQCLQLKKSFRGDIFVYIHTFIPSNF